MTLFKRKIHNEILQPVKDSIYKSLVRARLIVRAERMNHLGFLNMKDATKEQIGGK